MQVGDVSAAVTSITGGSLEVVLSGQALKLVAKIDAGSTAVEVGSGSNLGHREVEHSAPDVSGVTQVLPASSIGPQLGEAGQWDGDFGVESEELLQVEEQVGCLSPRHYSGQQHYDKSSSVVDIFHLDPIILKVRDNLQ